MSSHIDQLAEWWDGAEEGAARKGDTIIVRYDGDGEYGIRISDADLLAWTGDIRILARAPKPKPAWHDAFAVIARVDDGSQTPDTSRVALLRDVSEPGQWVRGYCDNVYSDELFDVTPLIEAKVTDAMIENALSARDHNGQPYFTDRLEASDFLTAALGIEDA